MAKDILGEAGLHFDELNKLRVLDPEVTQQTIELKEECKDFVDSECHLGVCCHSALSCSNCAPSPSQPVLLLALPEWSPGSLEVEPGLYEFPLAPT